MLSCRKSVRKQVESITGEEVSIICVVGISSPVDFYVMTK